MRDNTTLDPPRFRYAVYGGLVAGALDLIYISSFVAVLYGLGPQRILHSIAAGWVGHEAARGVFEERVLPEHPHLQPRRQAIRELDDSVIEVRKSPLDRVRHQHPVALRIEQVA